MPIPLTNTIPSLQDDAFKCYCGSDNCRGTMAPKKKTDKNSLSKAERNRLIVLGRKNLSKTDLQLQEEVRIWLVILRIEEVVALMLCFCVILVIKKQELTEH